MDLLAQQFNKAEIMIRLALVDNETVLLVSPEQADPDSISCLFAFYEYLQKKADKLDSKSRIFMYTPGQIAENTLYEFLDPLGDPHELVETNIPNEPVGLCILFDYGDATRTKTESLATPETFFIGFDHHSQMSGFPELGMEIIDVDAPSTTALLYRFFKHEKFPIDTEIATCLMVGLAADTGGFGNTLANAEAFASAAELIRLGARHHEITQAMRFHMTLGRFRAQHAAFPSVEINETAGYAFLPFSQKNLADWNATEKDMLAFRDLLKNTEEITIAVAYFELPELKGAWRGSIRTKINAPIYADTIAQHFKGNGHKHAAGFTSHETPNMVTQKIKRLIQEAQTKKSP